MSCYEKQKINKYLQMADFCMFFVDFVKSRKRESQTLMKMGGLCKIDNMVLGVYSHLKPKRKKKNCSWFKYMFFQFSQNTFHYIQITIFYQCLPYLIDVFIDYMVNVVNYIFIAELFSVFLLFLCVPYKRELKHVQYSIRK